MSKEIEKKYRVQNLDDVEKRLFSLGAVLQKESNERDLYFNVSGRDSIKTKECLRIRDSATKKEITYKPGTIEGLSQDYFAKRETNLAVTDVETAKEFLLSLGNEILVELVKKRKYFVLEGVTIALDLLNDKLPFVEIEVEGDDEMLALEKIVHIANLLELNPSSIEIRPYRDIALKG